MAKRKKTDRVQLPIRMRESLRAQIEKAAKEKDVSINTEVVMRLDRSFERQGLLQEVMTLAYGEEWAAMLMEAHKFGILRVTPRNKDDLRAVFDKFLETLPVKGAKQ